MENTVRNILRNEYQKKRDKAISDLRDRKIHVRTIIPELDEINNELTNLGLKYSKALLHGNTENLSVDEVQKKINLLKNEKVLLLKEAGFSPDYLEIHYECDLCKDTGFVEKDGLSHKCRCLKQSIINSLYDQSNLGLTKTENFSVFNDSYYSNIVNEKKYSMKISPRENINLIKEHCLKFISNFDSPEEKNLFFSGPTGTGKTFMASCVANELVGKGYTVLYQTSPVLFNIINEHKYGFSKETADISAYRNIFEAELLIIDDLGIEPQTPARYSELLTILNTRQINNLTKPCKMIISTNIGPKQLYQNYTERIMSRIMGNFERLMFIGDDIRLIKK